MAPSLKLILDGKHGIEGKYVDSFEGLKPILELLRRGGYSIVLTQGVYDMYHVGHQRYLHQASQFGDILIVGIDSDELTREMKGDDRPFDPLEERVEILAGLFFVNIIVRKDVGQHHNDLIELVRPDVLVMSKTTSTFTPERKREVLEMCGRIEHLEPQASTSTTAKFRRLRIDGAKGLAQHVTRAVEEYLEGGV